MINRQIDTERVTPWLCALAAVVLSAFAAGMFLSGEQTNLTSLLRMAPDDPIAQIAGEVEEELRFVPAGHYDGVYYYAIAIDPLATGEAHKVIDLASHRYGHPGYGWLGWVLSFGNPAWVPQALLIASLLGMGVAGYFASLIARGLGATPWGGLVIAFNPGLIFSVTSDTSEPVTIALLAVGLYLWIKEKHVAAAGVIAILCFFKFQMLLVPVGLALWELNRYRLTRSRENLVDKVGLLAIGPVAFIIWLGYVYVRFGNIPISGGPEFLSFPFVGWFDTMSDLSKIDQMDFQSVQLASAQLPILVALLALFTYALVRATRLRHPLDAVFLFQGLFVLLLNWWNLLYPKDMLRALAVPIPLLIAVLYIKRRQDENSTSETPSPT
jgi:hypothetical protein